MNEHFACYLISANIFGALISAVLLYGNIFETHHSERGRFYSIMAIVNILACISEAISWIFEGNTQYLTILNITTFFSINLAFTMFGAFAHYIFCHIKEKCEPSYSVFYSMLAIIAIVTIFSVIMSLTGNMYYYQDGSYCEGPLYPTYFVISNVALVVCIGIVIYYRKELGRHDCIAAIMYILVPIISAIISLFVEEWSFTYCAISISLLILYIMIQADQTSKLEKEKEISNFYANHDELTGLNSRRAYIEKLDTLSNKNVDIGVLFCDVNALKYENDHNGHKAGDKLLITIGSYLARQYRKEDVYRISGDEFIALAVDISKDEFYSRAYQFKESLNKGEYELASIGIDYGNSKDVNTLIQTAEAKMYNQKDAFHQMHPDLMR